MTDHDPLCRLNLSDCDHGNTRVCHCSLIARVRADEVERRFGWVSREDAVAYIEADVRGRLRAQVEAYFADTYSKARYKHANDPDHRHYWEGYRDALDIAEQAVLALLGGESDERA